MSSSLVNPGQIGGAGGSGGITQRCTRCEKEKPITDFTRVSGRNNPSKQAATFPNCNDCSKKCSEYNKRSEEKRVTNRNNEAAGPSQPPLERLTHHIDSIYTILEAPQRQQSQHVDETGAQRFTWPDGITREQAQGTYERLWTLTDAMVRSLRAADEEQGRGE